MRAPENICHSLLKTGLRRGPLLALGRFSANRHQHTCPSANARHHSCGMLVTPRGVLVADHRLLRR